jgi:hypothetical protein
MYGVGIPSLIGAAPDSAGGIDAVYEGYGRTTRWTRYGEYLSICTRPLMTLVDGT